jgi:molybdopterin converting factor small subunit
MPRVTVEAVGFLRTRFAGRVVVSVPDGMTVDGVLRHLADRDPHFAALVYRDGEVSDALQIVVRDQLIELAGGLGRVLADGDEIVLLPPFEGGSV